MHRCILKEGRTGRCGARIAKNGSVVSLSYGLITSLALDPIEKKPLARFCPGSMVLSAGSFGCNLSCMFCQNASIAGARIENAKTEYFSPERLAALAAQLIPKGNIGVAYTYNEPMIGYEFVRDTARIVRAGGMKNVVVTNGSVCIPTLREVLPWIDAFNIDLKGFSEDWYRRLGGDLQTVLAFIREAAAHSHVEVTTLVVPGENDSADEMKKIAAFIESVDRSIPLHITRFFPRHLYADRVPTDIRKLRELADIARETLDTVLIGNV